MRSKDKARQPAARQQPPTAPARVVVAALPSLYMAHTSASVAESGEWYRNFEYHRERERGLDYREDLFNPLVLTFDLSYATDASVVASTERRNVSLAESYEVAERQRREAILSHVVRKHREWIEAKRREKTMSLRVYGTGVLVQRKFEALAVDHQGFLRASRARPLGGFASSSIVGMNTRRHHGLAR